MGVWDAHARAGGGADRAASYPYIERTGILDACGVGGAGAGHDVESAIAGTEVAVGIVGTPGDVLPAVEIVPKGGTYDYAARYTAGATEYFAPARLSEEAATACSDVAMAAWKALRLRDVTRVDMIVDPDGKPWVLEVNVSPGMTETSLLPMGANAAGMGLPQLCDAVIQSALSWKPD